MDFIAHSDLVQEISDADINNVITSNPVVVIDFYADWCGPCKAVSPIVENIAAKYTGRIAVYVMNVDANLIVPKQYNVRSIPTVLILKNGVEVNRIVGASVETVYTTAIDAALAN